MIHIQDIFFGKKAVLTIVFFITFICISSITFGQNNSDSLVSKKIQVYVEEYYTVTKSDLTDTTGGIIPNGSIVYRIYINLPKGYLLQALYGAPNHPLKIESTSTIFNNTQLSGVMASDILDNVVNQNSIALDSWITIGAATKTQIGIPKQFDTNQSIITRKKISKQDGLLPGTIPNLIIYGINTDFFTPNSNSMSLVTENGMWAIPSGYSEKNTGYALVAQLTTNGKISIELNLQILSPSGKVIQCVAKNATENEIECPQLNYKMLK